MGKDFSTACLSQVCCGRKLDLPGEWCSTYSCHYSRNFQPGDDWIRHYWTQKSNQAGHPAAGESLGQRDSCPAPDRPQWSDSVCALDHTSCAPCPTTNRESLPVCDGAPVGETGGEGQGNRRARQKWKTPISRPKEDKLMHWSQQHQKSQEAKYRWYQNEFDKNFGSGHKSNMMGEPDDISQSVGQQQCIIPPRDIMVPRPSSILDRCWKGVPIPSDDPVYEPIYPSDTDCSLFEGSKNPFMYFNRSRKFPDRNNRSDARPVTDCDILTPDQLGTFGSVVDSRLSRRHIAKARVSQRYLAAM